MSTLKLLEQEIDVGPQAVKTWAEGKADDFVVGTTCDGTACLYAIYLGEKLEDQAIENIDVDGYSVTLDGAYDEEREEREILGNQEIPPEMARLVEAFDKLQIPGVSSYVVVTAAELLDEFKTRGVW